MASGADARRRERRRRWACARERESEWTEEWRDRGQVTGVRLSLCVCCVCVRVPLCGVLSWQDGVIRSGCGERPAATIGVSCEECRRQRPGYAWASRQSQSLQPLHTAAQTDRSSRTTAPALQL